MEAPSAAGASIEAPRRVGFGERYTPPQWGRGLDVSVTVKYDYTVDLTGTGDRSEFDIENY